MYRRRGDPAPTALRRPKRLVALFDASASMFRFNGYDGRLARSQDCLCLLLEALGGSSRVDVCAAAHSGDGPESLQTLHTAFRTRISAQRWRIPNGDTISSLLTPRIPV